MKESRLRKGPRQGSTPLKKGNMDITLSNHNYARYMNSNLVYQGGEGSLLNGYVMVLQSESTLLNQMKFKEDEVSKKNLLRFQPRKNPLISF